MQILKMRITLFTVFILLLASCSEYSIVVKKGTNDQKYDMAVAMYKKRDYNRALPLLEDLLAIHRGKPKSEEVYYYYCYSYFALGQYQLAGYHFKNFTENYFNSKHIKECSYMYAHCLYKEALPYYLEQSETEKAISEMQLFLNKYPDSTYRNEGNRQIEELRNNLKRKSFENAMLYYKIEDYRAATVTFKNTLKDFPDVSNKYEIDFYIVKAAYLYAKNSVDEKKVERYNEVFKEYKDYLSQHKPTDKYYAEVVEINQKAEKELNNFINKNK